MMQKGCYKQPFVILTKNACEKSNNSCEMHNVYGNMKVHTYSVNCP